MGVKAGPHIHPRTCSVICSDSLLPNSILPVEMSQATVQYPRFYLVA